MNSGLLIKAAREAVVPTAILSIALLLLQAILTLVLPTFLEDLSAQILQMPFIRTMLSALLGMDLGDMLGPETISAFAWVHPVALAIVWTHAVVYCTRLPAGEIDRGTIDVLFGLPVSRWRVYRTDAVVFMAGGLVMLTMGFLGHRIGILNLEQGERPGYGRLLAVVSNLFCLSLAVGGLAQLVSSACDRRGRAIGVVFALLLGSFLLNFLAQFWPPAQAVSFLGLLNYYRPLAVLQSGGHWPITDMAVLTAFATAAWIAGGVWFARRDLCTV